MFSFFVLMYVIYLIYLALVIIRRCYIESVLKKITFVFKVGLIFSSLSVFYIVVLRRYRLKLTYCGSGFWLGNGFVLMIDFFSLFFLSIGFLVSWSIFSFGLRYVWEESYNKFFILSLTVFLMFMLLLVLSGNYLVLFLR